METTFKVRNLNNDDISNVMNIQKQDYSNDLQEDRNVFIQILNVFSEGVFGVFDGDNLAGYLFSHPYLLNQVKPLNSQLYLTGEENCLYLHDMAISPDYRGMGLAKRLFERFLFTSEKIGFESQRLVAVQNSAEFWGRFGFRQNDFVNASGYANGYYMQRLNANL
ncbi:MAG TPA: GNAT family N-acetyltransferase [Bacteroidales bacterium]|nr:GNAT family N-acetyltransferase [Bacteroidales bacterium]HSA42357.1 GNAT family N-acetyltransferase [Bacteroidales bacterium]